MKKVLAQIGKFSYFFAAFFVLFQLNAHAYIDPSAVSYVVQAVAAVVIAIGAALTIFRHKIAALFRKNSKQEAKKEIHFTEDEENTEETKSEE